MNDTGDKATEPMPGYSLRLTAAERAGLMAMVEAFAEKNLDAYPNGRGAQSGLLRSVAQQAVMLVQDAGDDPFDEALSVLHDPFRLLTAAGRALNSVARDVNTGEHVTPHHLASTLRALHRAASLINNGYDLLRAAALDRTATLLPFRGKFRVPERQSSQTTPARVRLPAALFEDLGRIAEALSQNAGEALSPLDPVRRLLREAWNRGPDPFERGRGHYREIAQGLDAVCVNLRQIVYADSDRCQSQLAAYDEPISQLLDILTPLEDRFRRVQRRAGTRRRIEPDEADTHGSR